MIHCCLQCDKGASLIDFGWILYRKIDFLEKIFQNFCLFWWRWTVVKSEASVREPLVLRGFGHVSRSHRQFLTNERVWWGVGRRPARRHAPRARGKKRKNRQCGYVTPHWKNFPTLPKPRIYEKIWFLVVKKPNFAPNLGKTTKKHILGLGYVSWHDCFWCRFFSYTLKIHFC